MAHCIPLLDNPSSAWILGAATATIVWSMNVIATAKIIAVKIRPRDLVPLALLSVTLIACSPHGSRLMRPVCVSCSLRTGGAPIISQMTTENRTQQRR